MMTFEAFFLKKKIDLVALKATKPDLYAEFINHYAQMGEKSFDHTKKYWFNQLRISHPLSEEDEVRLKTELFPAKEVEITSAEKPVETTSPTTTTSGFKPRFKANATIQKTEIAAEKEEQIEADPTTGTIKPASGFKPRFKAANMPAKPKED
jgi:hypothetical protein